MCLWWSLQCRCLWKFCFSKALGNGYAYFCLSCQTGSESHGICNSCESSVLGTLPLDQRIKRNICFHSQFISWPCELHHGPQFSCVPIPQKSASVSVFLSSIPVPVLHIQLYPGADLLLRVPAGELRAENADHDGGPGELQYHPAAHPRPRPGRLQPGAVRKVSCSLPLLISVLLQDVDNSMWAEWKLVTLLSVIIGMRASWKAGSGRWWVFLLFLGICVIKYT